MAYGGGTWLTQNKVLPGTYINFTGLSRATVAISDRGIAAVPLVLSWGAEDSIIEVSADDFRKNSKTIFGYGYEAPELLALRELFCHAVKAYCYRLGSGAVKAKNTYGTAKYPGIRGNDITVSVAKNPDDTDLFDVTTYISGVNFQTQTVADAAALCDNDFVIFNKEISLAENETAGSPMSGGENCESITGEHHQAFLNAVEGYSYNALCCPAEEAQTVALYAAFNKRMRDTVGTKGQLVAWQSNADYEGVIGIWNEVSHYEISNVPKQMLVYWMTGAQSAVAVNKSLTNTAYDGELTVDTHYTLSELEQAIESGKLILHNVNGDVRVLEDINTLVTFTDEKGELFRSNQTVRVCDQISNDVAVLFNTRYAGQIANDASGRAMLWNDIVKLIKELERIRAVEGFEPDMVTVEAGDAKNAVLLTVNGLGIVNSMDKLYMSVIIQ